MTKQEMRWTKTHEKAAALVADDHVTDAQIAAAIGYTRKTLAQWKQQPAFKARVAELVDAARAAALSEAIAVKAERLRGLQDLARRHWQVVMERAADPAMAGVPGGTSGLLVHHYKSIGAGENAEKVDEYEDDTALSAELRNLYKQAAIEMGEWSERHELTGKDGKDLTAVVTVYIPENGRDA